MKKEIEQSLGNIIESVESRTLQEDTAKIEGYILGLESALEQLN